MRRVHPLSLTLLQEIEAEVLGAGQMLLEAGSEPRARLALQAIHCARWKLNQLGNPDNSFTA